MEDVLSFLRSLLPMAADLTSLVGFVLTVWLALTVQKIRNFYLLGIRGPELARRLVDAASVLSANAATASAKRDEILEAMGSAETALSGLRRRVTGGTFSSLTVGGWRRELSGEMKALEKELAHAQSPGEKGPDSRRVMELYRKINKVVLRVEDAMADQRWEQ